MILGKAKRTHEEHNGLFTCDTHYLNGCVDFIYGNSGVLGTDSDGIGIALLGTYKGLTPALVPYFPGAVLGGSSKPGQHEPKEK